MPNHFSLKKKSEKVAIGLKHRGVNLHNKNVFLHNKGSIADVKGNFVTRSSSSEVKSPVCMPDDELNGETIVGFGLEPLESDLTEVSANEKIEEETALEVTEPMITTQENISKTFEDLSPDVRMRTELVNNITSLTRIKNKGFHEVIDFCLPRQKEFLSNFEKADAVTIEFELEKLRNHLYNGY